MKKTFTNSTHIEGYVYEHKLEEKVSGPNSKNPGTQFINGTLSIATDDQMLNVVQVHFSYVTAVTAKGSPNATYNTLKAIIDGRIGNVMENGAETAGRVRIDSAIGLNEWYDTRTEGNPLVSVKRNEGGFVHQMSASETLNEDQNARATFNTDMLIVKATRYEADEEKETPERMTLKGYIFDFRKSLLPVEYTVTNPLAMDYFENQEISEKTPFFTRVQGVQVSKTITKTTTEASAFGDAVVKQTKSSYRDYIVTWASNDPYAWDDEATLLATELQELQSQRQLYLADVKKRQDEYQASKNAANNAIPSAAAAPAKGAYDF